MDNQFQHAEAIDLKNYRDQISTKSKRELKKEIKNLEKVKKKSKDDTEKNTIDKKIVELKTVLASRQNALEVKVALASRQNASRQNASRQNALEVQVAAIEGETNNRAVRKACRLYLNYDNIIKDTWLQTQLTKEKLFTFIEHNKNNRDVVVSENKVEEKQETTDKITGEMLLSFDGKVLYVTGDIRIKKDNVWLRFASDTEAMFCVDGTLTGSWCLRDKDKTIDSSEVCKKQLDNVTNVLYEGSILEEIKHALEERAKNVLRVQHASKEVQQAVEPDAIFRSRVLAANDATNYRALDPLYNRDIEKEKQNVKMAKKGVVKVAFVSDIEEAKEKNGAAVEVFMNKSKETINKLKKIELEEAARKEAQARRKLAQRREAVYENIVKDDEEKKEMEDSDDDLSMLMSDKHVLDSLASLSESDGVQDVGVSSESEVDVREMDALLGSDSDTEFQFAATSDEDVSLTSMLNTFASDEDEEEEVKWASTSSGAD